MAKRRILPGLLISLLLLMVVFYRLDMKTFLETLKSVSLLPVGIALCLSVATLGIRSWRWHYLLAPIKLIPWRPLLAITSIGAMTDMLLPARAGDLVRAYQVGQKEQISKVTSLATLVLEKLLDVLTIASVGAVLLVIVALGRLQLSLPPEFQLGLSFTIPLVVLLTLLLWLASVKTAWFSHRLQRVLGWLPHRLATPVLNGFESFVAGIQAIKSGHHTGRIFILSLLLWTVFGLNNFLIMEAFSLHLPFYAALFVLIFQVIGVTLPSSPGAIGTYHAAVLVSLALFGISRELALSVAIIMHGAFFLPFLLVGTIFLWQEELSFGILVAINVDEPKA